MGGGRREGTLCTPHSCTQRASGGREIGVHSQKKSWNAASQTLGWREAERGLHLWREEHSGLTCWEEGGEAWRRRLGTAAAACLPARCICMRGGGEGNLYSFHTAYHSAAAREMLGMQA